jgi:3D (Asp-Asp-Asp) domain-containing protein
MRLFLLSISQSLIAAFLFSNCASDSSVKIVKADYSIFASYRKANINVPAPSSGLVAAANQKPRDRHNMPVYKFGERNRIVRTTAYTCSESDHLKYGAHNAVGTMLKYNDRVRSAAADWSFYPLGTVFKIKGRPYIYVVDDYGSALIGAGTIDIYQPSGDMMNMWGRRNVEISVLQWGSLERSAEILSKRMNYDHCRQMYANIQRLRGGSRATASR